MDKFILGLVVGAFAGYQYFWQRQKKRAIAQLMEEVERGIEWAFLCKDFEDYDPVTRQGNAKCFVCKHMKRSTAPKCFVDTEGEQE